MTIGITVALLGLLAYAWVGYPVLLAALARLCSRATTAAPATALPARSLAILFSAHNEEAHIAPRLENLVAACEGLTRTGVDCRILVGADGCTDRTVPIAADWARRHALISVHEATRQGGKIRMLKELVAHSVAEVLVFTDANTEFKTGAIERLLAPFLDSDVGGVCGRLVLGNEREGSGFRVQGSVRSSDRPDESPPEGAYWQWENRLKERESKLDSCLGVNGAIYAVRRELFWRDVPDNAIVDDFVLGMKVRERGFRVLYEPLAVAVEELPDTEHEWRRRVRIGAGDFQALALCRRCLRPSYGWFAWSFFSHKVLRWFTPHMLLALVALALAMEWQRVQGSGFRVQGGEDGMLLSRCILAGALAAVCCVAVARVANRRETPVARWLRPVMLVDHMITMQAALFAGWLRYLGGDLKGHWTRTPRKEV